MRFTALPAIALLALCSFSPAHAASSSERCQTVYDSYVFRSIDKNFSQVVQSLNAQVSKKVVPTGSNPDALRAAKPIPPNTEMISIRVSAERCGKALASSIAGGPNMSTKALQCNFVGCTEDLPTDIFGGIPVGGTVSINTCGGGISTTSNYQRQSNGTFRMTGFRTEQVTQCEPM